MNDVISIFKNDLYNFIDHLNIDKNIKHIKKQNVSIDFFSKSRLGDLSTNLLILSKYRDVNHFDIKSYVFNFLTKLLLFSVETAFGLTESEKIFLLFGTFS